jgi:hypothetical protein
VLEGAEVDGYCMLLGALHTKDQRVVGRLEKHKHVSRTNKELKKK